MKTSPPIHVYELVKSIVTVCAVVNICKLEDFTDAIKRISLNEIGMELNNGKPLGVYRHLYKYNFETEYIVFPYLFTVNNVEIKIDDQHSIVKWYYINVKKYFYDTINIII